jgi:hypothetical protein
MRRARAQFAPSPENAVVMFQTMSTPQQLCAQRALPALRLKAVGRLGEQVLRKTNI